MTAAPSGARRRSRPPARVLLVRWAVVATGLVLVVAVVLAATSGSAPPSRPHAGAAGSTTSTTPTTTTVVPPKPLVATVAGWHLPVPVSRAVVLTEGSELLVLGGLTTGDVSTPEVVQVDPTHGSASVAGQLGTAVHDAAGAVLGGRALVFGGGAVTTLTEVQTWAAGVAGAAGNLPVARSDLAAAAVGGTAYVVGGFDGTNLVAAVLATDDGTTFRTVGQLLQPVRYPAVAAAGSEIWVVGGELATTEGTLAGPQTTDIQVFDPATGLTRVIGHLPEPLGHAGAFTLDGSVYVVGGRTGATATKEIWRISPSGTVTSAGTLPFAFSDMGVAVEGGAAWLIGGETTGPTAPLEGVVEVRPAS